jgi:hypothetical protein
MTQPKSFARIIAANKARSDSTASASTPAPGVGLGGGGTKKVPVERPTTQANHPVRGATVNIQIKNRFDDSVIFEGDYDCLLSAVKEAFAKGADLYGADLRGADLRSANLCSANLCSANLYGANLYGANLRGANLYGADLCSADLRGANLSGADLRGANLCSADLCGANLCGADLRGAKGLNPLLMTQLYLLREQPGAIRSYKMVTWDLRSPIHGEKITYTIGSNVGVDDANTNEQEQCGAGINLATADWVIKNWSIGNRVLIAEHTAADIAAIPIGSDGKYRVHRCKIVGEKPIDYFGLGEAKT